MSLTRNLLSFGVCFFCFICASFSAYSQVNATQARHETDAQQSTTLTLSGNLTGNYTTSAGWSVTVGGVPATIASVFGTNGSNLLTITWSSAAVSVGQAVVVNFTGDAAINPVTNLASQNNRVLACSDFTWQGVNTPTPNCAPVTPITNMIFAINRGARNSSLFNFNDIVIRVSWGQGGNFSNLAEYESDINGIATANSYYITVNAATSGFSYPSNETVCGYVSFWTPRISGSNCSAAFALPGQFVTYNSFNTDAAGEGDGALSLPPTVANTDLVCLGDNVNMTFSDQTNRNCAPDPDGTGPLNANDGNRWVRVRYGYPDAGAGLNIPNIFVGGVQVTDASGNLLPAFTTDGYIPLVANALGTPDAIGVVTFPASQPNDANRVLELITTSSPTGQVVGQVFNVTMEYWNQCNPYSFPITTNARTIANEVVIITTPDPPTVPSRDVCSGESLTLTVNPNLGFTYRWYATQANAIANTSVLSTGVSFTPSSAQAPAGRRTHFFVTATGGNGCVSDPTDVTITRRSALSQPTTISGPVNLCPSSNYVYTLPTDPPDVTITDITTGTSFNLATEYFWTVPAGWTIVSGQGTRSITVTSNSVVSSGNISVENRYITPTSNATQCSGTARTLAVNVRARPTANISPDPANICEGGTIQLNGNPTLPPNATGFTPSISGHLWGGSSGILDDPSLQQPTVQASTTSGTYNLTYVVTADFGNSVFCSSTADNSVVNVSANPTLASVGANQNLCFPVGPLVSNSLGGSSPGVGTGTWTRQSGPGTATFSPDANTPGATATVTANGIYVFRWTVVNGSCSSFAEITVDYGTSPATPDAGLAQDVCGLTTNLAGTVPTFETGTWFQTAGPGTTTFSNLNSATASITATAFGSYTYRWRFTSGTCAPADDFVTITFRQPPTVTGLADFTTCVDGGTLAPIALSGTFGGGATQARWERLTGSGTFTSNGTAVGNFDNSNPATDSYTPTAADFTAGSVQLQLVTDDPTGGCVAVSDPVTLTFDRLPANAAAGADFSTCDPVINLAATAPNNGGIGTWSVGNAIFYETFPSGDNGVGAVGPVPPNVPTAPASGNWTVNVGTGNLVDAADFFRVNAGRFEAQDVNAEMVWQSKSINITAVPNVTVSVQLGEFGAMEGTDYIRAFYKINGGAEILIGGIDDDNAIEGDNAYRTVSVSGLTGNTIEVVIRVANDAGTELHFFDNVYVSSSGTTLPFITDINSPTTSVTGLQTGTTTFTWTVSSALGVCSASNDAVVTTRHVAPVNNDPLPALCEDVATGGTASVSLAYLNSLNDGITGIAGSTGRLVEYFVDATRLIAFTGPSNISDTDVLYTRVTRTDVVPGCITEGTITFTINSRPVANVVAPEFCEDLPLGSGSRNDVNLTPFENGITGGVGNRSVQWFDASLVAIPDPTNIDGVTDGLNFIARVTNTLSGCTNDVTIEVTINSRPALNPIIGATNVCADASAINLYQVQNVNVTSTYDWTVPTGAGEFVQFGGGDPTFFVLLSFPNLVNPGKDIIVVETNAKGCVGLADTLNITVETSPPPITIVGPTAVCENQAGVNYSVAALANTTYSWTVPVGASIISGQGTNSINVNFGITPGNIEVLPTTTTGCAGNPDDEFVTINPKPSLDNLFNTVCSDVNGAITLSGTGANTFNITSVTVPPGLNPPSRGTVTGGVATEIFNDIFTNTTGGNLTVQYSVVPVSSAGCEGTAQLVNLTVRPEPTLAPNLNDEICSTADAVGIVLDVATGSFPADQYQITSIVSNGLTPLAGNPTTGIFSPSVLLDDKWLNTTGAAVNVEYFIRPINSTTTCIGDPPLPVTIKVNPEPVIVAPAPETICSGDLPVTTLTSSIPASTFTWTVKNIAGLVTGTANGNGSNITNILVNTSGAPGSVTYEVVSSSPGALGACASQPVDFIVNVNTSPDGNNISQAICSDVAGGNTALTNLVGLQPTINGSGGITFAWYQDAGLTAPIGTPAAYTMTSGVPVFAEVDNGQCAKVAQVVFTINPTPSVSATITSNYNGFQLSCNGSSDAQITGVSANGTGPYLFSIDGGGSFFTSGVFNGLSVAGNPYVVRTRDSNGCIANSNPLTIVPPTAVSALTAKTKNYNGADVTCQAAADGEITVTPGGGTGTYTFRLLELPSNNTGNASGIYTGLRAGSYTFVVTDANNCQFTTNTVTVTEPTALQATAVLTTPVTCNGNSDGVVTVTATGGTLAGPAYSFTLNQPPGTINTTGIFNGLAAGAYTVNVTDDNGCLRTSNTVNVTQPSVLTAFASVTSNYNGAKISCNGAGDAQVTAVPNGGNGGYSFLLVEIPANVTGQADGSFELLPPGNYSITVTDAFGCSVTTAQVNVTEPNPVVPSTIVSNDISCNGSTDGEITVSAIGGTGSYNFERVPGVTNVSGVFGGLGQGTYDFIVTDVNGCAGNTQRILNEPTLVSAVAAVTSNYNGSQISCNGATDGVITITASGGTGAFTYVFDQFTLTNTTGQFSGVFTGVANGAGYTFTVRDANSCSAVSVPISVTQPAPVVPSGVVTSNYNGQQISCFGFSDAQVTASAIGGTGAYVFRLDQEPTNTTGNAGGIYTGLEAGTYTISVRDANNCFGVSAPITVTQPTQLTGAAVVTSNYNGRQITCNGASDGQITVQGVGGGVPAYSYQLIEIPANTTGNTDAIYDGVPEGVYTFRITDLNGCVRITSPVSIADPDVLTASASVTSNYNGQQVSCFGASDAQISITAAGGTTAYMYTFVQIPGNVSGQTNGIFTGIPFAASYTFQVRDVNNCATVTAPVSVSQPPQLTASAVVTSNYNGQQISCNGANDAIITVTSAGGTGTATYVFDQFAATNLSGKFSGIFTSVQDGTGYTFTATDVNNCAIVTAPLNVTEPAAISATGVASSNYNGFDVSCFNGTNGELTVNPVAGGTAPLAFTLLENPGNITGQANGVFTGLRAGSYRVRIADVNGCLFTTTATPLTQPSDISIAITKTSNFNGFDVSCEGAADGRVSVTTITGGAGSYQYVLDQTPANVTGQNSGVFTGLTAGLYSVTVTDINTCTKQSIPVVLIDPLPLFEGVIGMDDAICIGQGDPDPFTELAAAFGGIGNYAYQWQQSPDGVTFSNITVNGNSATYDAPASLAATTFYKRLITSGTCATLESNVVRVVVNPLPTVVQFAPSKSPVCEDEFFIMNTEFTGTAPFFFDYTDFNTVTNTTTNVSRIGAASTPIPIVNYSQERTFTLTQVRDFNGCIINPNLVRNVPISRINPNFNIVNPAPQCSGGTFNFTWNVDPNVQYTWIWPDGTSDVIAPNSLPNGTNPISHVFTTASTSGNSNQPVILTAINSIDGCGPKQSNQAITLLPTIIANVFPAKTEICGDDDILFNNPTVGGTSHIWTIREQLSGVVVETRALASPTNQTFTFNNTSSAPIQNPLVYEVVYDITNGSCSEQIIIPITVYREITANFSNNPLEPEYIGGQATATITNLSSPVDGTVFDYAWEFGVGAQTPTANGTGPFNVTYLSPGLKTVRLVATNTAAQAAGLTCASTIERTFLVKLPDLVALFDYTPQNSCFPTDIVITDNNATGDIYEWELINEQTAQTIARSNDALPTFRIANPGSYSILLTTRNSITGQTASRIIDEPINIYPNPFAGFEVRPPIVYVPDTELVTFNFSTETGTADDVIYNWNFGDSPDFVEGKEPIHQYQTEGLYTILLRVDEHHFTAGGTITCSDTATTRITAKEAGFTRLPNSFTPSINGPSGGNSGAGTVNDVFLPITKGVVEFQMQIFDRWGNLVFESQDKNVGWDGYDRNGRLMPAGVYIYKLVLRLSNGERTTNVGDITLIR